MKKIRVLIVEDSKVVRQYLEHLIARDPRLEVAGAVGSAEEALRRLQRIAPDVISMDIRLPGMDGFEATRRIMSERPTPIVVISACIDAADTQAAMRALKAGALSVLEKPVGARHADYESMAQQLCTHLATMSQIQVVRQRFNGPRRALKSPRPRPVGAVAAGGPGIVGIVASTGGPHALQCLLGDLGRDFPLPILLVQHITPSFHDGFVSWLDSVCPLRVQIAHDGEQPQPGHVYLAPPDRHLTIVQRRLYLDRQEPVCAERPSGTVLFRSLARAEGPRALGVILTGMGQDGAEGLAELRAAGGYTIAEDESTCVVFGMPAAAVELGAACEILPLDAIGPRLRECVRPLRSALDPTPPTNEEPSTLVP